VERLLPEYYAEAAVRHFFDAEKLAGSKSFDGAGHLVGFAAECAIKYCIEELRPANQAPHLHFPELVEKAKRLLHGRRKHPLFTLLQRPAFMAAWRIEHRYADNGTVTEQHYLTWRGDASRALGAAQLRGTKDAQ
jgi:hypothetical protein